MKCSAAENGMLDDFRSLLPDGGKVLISEEAADYRQKLAWLSQQLDATWTVSSAEAHEIENQAIYWFFELFDLEIRARNSATRAFCHP